MEMESSGATPTVSDRKIDGIPNEASDSLLPAFTTKNYTHLPTPQSPNNLGRYISDRPYSPESPILNRQNLARKPALDNEKLTRQESSIQQYITPESSPHFLSNSNYENSDPATPRYFVQSSSNDFTTPKHNLTKTHATLPLSSNIGFSRRNITPPQEPPKQTSTLSSPFMAKLTLGNKRHESQITSLSLLKESEGTILATETSSSPPMFPPQDSLPQPPKPGGELDRIHQLMKEDRLNQIREAEKRRPDYLKRAKRTLSEVDSGYQDDADGEGDKPVGIMESPQKGRRLKLFQETSEESFEESLMAGGYGRYRTADWVRQPQPISLPQNAMAGSSSIVSILEDAHETPPTEKELKKKKRLAAFQIETINPNNKLCPVELDGKGRVLVDTPLEERVAPGSPEPVNKKKVSNRKKKKANDLTASKRLSISSGAINENRKKPNWPDAEFPWRLRTEERLELTKAEEEERLRWIERFLDRDSDDDEEFDHPSEQPSYINSGVGSSHDQAPESYRPAKSVPLPNFGYHEPSVKRLHYPSDPADARAALLAKRSVRALSYRQQKRQREHDDEDDDEVVCICHGRDDGRELVQCDACQTWYHLRCIGIKSISELGREEDPWFCRQCVARSRSPSVEPLDILSSEPTFVPTDEELKVRRSSDTPFFHPGVIESPNWSVPRMPKTPTRGPFTSDPSYSWIDSSRTGPSTPQDGSRSVRIYSSPYEGYTYNYDESPFDPTSTPSRGIKFHAPFTTPKSNGWISRPGGSLFQTPSRPSARVNNNKQINHLDEHVHEPPGRRVHYNESPIRRIDDTSLTHRSILPSSPRTKPYASNTSLFEESPVMRSMESQILKTKHRDEGQRPVMSHLEPDI